jgi:hypothetical protein
MPQTFADTELVVVARDLFDFIKTYIQRVSS